jgi:hypothetical protein
MISAFQFPFKTEIGTSKSVHTAGKFPRSNNNDSEIVELVIMILFVNKLIT